MMIMRPAEREASTYADLSEVHIEETVQDGDDIERESSTYADIFEVFIEEAVHDWADTERESSTYADLSEVLIEESVHDGVETCGAHGGEMDHGKPHERVLIVRLLLLKPKIDDRVYSLTSF